MAVSPRAVWLHIEELILDGFPADQRLPMADAMERELERLIAERGLGGIAKGAVELDELRGGAFRVAPGASPKKIGAQLAEAIHRPLAETGTPQLRTAKAAGRRP